jgi:NAD(P)-dependent dehydrogenase (short-subunit alcohol dehydrogenase family)
MNRLNDKVAIITGGNSGVGAECARLFADEGAKVVISARRKDKLDQVAEEIRSNGGEVLAVVCDIAKPEDAKKLVEAAISEYGQIDILVNNAGVLEQGLKPIAKAEDADIDRIIDTNLKGTMYITREVAKEMESASEGSIVTVASVAGEKGCGGAAYSASKAGLIGLTKHTALRYGGKGIRANAVCPGTIMTPMTMNSSRDDMDADMMGAMLSHLDLQAGTCTPEDVANIVLFLASDESQAMTGQVLVCDFGSSL